MNQKLILFDFDGTLTKKDTLLEFILYYHGFWNTLLGMTRLLPVIVSWKLHLMPNQKAKEKVLQYFFANIEEDHFNAKCLDFSNRVIPHLIKPAALTLLHTYQKEKARIVVISASPENWVKQWCDTWAIECIATKLDIKQRRVTGKILGLNCYGIEKERRIREWLNLADYNPIIAYGDSGGDKEMIALAHEKHYRKL